MAANWFVKLIWNLIFTLVHANHSINRNPKSCFALINIIKLNAIRKFYEASIFDITFKKSVFLDSMV